MFLTLLKTLLSTLATHRSLALENLALRQQLAILPRVSKRPCLIRADRLFGSFCQESGEAGLILSPL